MVFNNLKSVTVFGFADCPQDSELYKDAFEVSRVMAENKLVVVNGGGPGVMRAATEGAHAGGGQAWVATFYPKFIENFEGKDRLNKADKEIIEDNYVTRTMKLLELGNAYVVFNGGTGTLSEFGMAWGLAYLYFGHHKPLILYGEFWYPIMEELAKNMLISTRPGSLRVYKIATTPAQVIEYLHEFDLEMGSFESKGAKDDGTGEKSFLNEPSYGELYTASEKPVTPVSQVDLMGNDKMSNDL